MMVALLGLALAVGALWTLRDRQRTRRLLAELADMTVGTNGDMRATLELVMTEFEAQNQRLTALEAKQARLVAEANEALDKLAKVYESLEDSHERLWKRIRVVESVQEHFGPHNPTLKVH
jgi:predicted nuclease with TOPRIM domain